MVKKDDNKHGYKVVKRKFGEKRYKRFCVCNTMSLAKMIAKSNIHPPDVYMILSLSKRDIQKINKDCPFDINDQEGV